MESREQHQLKVDISISIYKLTGTVNIMRVSKGLNKLKQLKLGAIGVISEKQKRVIL